MRWWQETSDETLVTIKCDGCELADGHQHIDVAGRARVDIEPIYWGATLSDIGRWTAALWVLRTGITLGVLHVVAAMHDMSIVFIQHFEGNSRVRRPIRGIFTSTLAAFGLIARAVLIPVLTLIGALFMFFEGPRRKVRDARAWSSDAESHGRIDKYVRDIVSSRDADEHILVGHSQGGSILTDLVRGGFVGKEAELITVGSGHGLLATQRVLNNGWRTYKSILLFAVFSAFIVLLLWGLLYIVDQTAKGMVSISASMFEFGAAIWMLGVDPEGAVRLAASATERSIATALTGLSASDATLISLSMIMSTLTFLMIALLGYFINPWLEEIRAANACDQPGVDLIATHDPVSSVLPLLGNRRRIVRIPQTHSVVLDHATYFRNGPIVLSEITRRIEEAARGTRTAPGRDAGDVKRAAEESGRELSGGLVARRWAAIALALAGCLSLNGVLSPHTAGNWALVVSLAGAAGLLSLSTLGRLRLLERVCYLRTR